MRAFEPEEQLTAEQKVYRLASNRPPTILHDLRFQVGEPTKDKIGNHASLKPGYFRSHAIITLQTLNWSDTGFDSTFTVQIGQKLYQGKFSEHMQILSKQFLGTRVWTGDKMIDTVIFDENKPTVSVYKPVMMATDLVTELMN